MNETAMLADHLDEQVDAILAVWKQTVEHYGNVPDAERLTYREFIDHIPELLERLADRLRGRAADSAESGQKHGKHRWSQGYDVAEVVSELGHLRSVLLRDLFKFAQENNFSIKRTERVNEAINHVIDEATAESVRQFDEDAKSLNRAVLTASEDRKRNSDATSLKYQTLLNHLPVGVWVCDAKGTLIEINREAERLQGFDSEELIGKVNITEGIPEYISYRTDGSVYEFKDVPLARALRGEIAIQEECLWPTPTGNLVVTSNSVPVKIPSGEIIGAIVVVQDITERKRLEHDLAISEARYRGYLAKTPVMIWRADNDGERDFFNETWLGFRGRSHDQESGHGWIDGVHEADRESTLKEYRQGIAERRPFEITYRLLHHEGEYRWVIDRGAPYHDSKMTFLGYLGSCLDITARVELEAALERQSQHKSRLMSALSHDARTPLNAVVLAARLLEDLTKDLGDPEIKDSLTTIRNSVRNVLDLLSDLLDLSRIDAGATRAEVSRFALAPTLAECLSSVEPQARDKGIDVSMNLGNLDQAGLETDRAKLKQILSNLLSNALRYTERGRIRLFAQRTRSSIQIGVEDTGIGIASGDQTRIFDEFAVLEHPNRARTEGTGLGLAICRRLAHLLQGEILLDSEPGRGSTFVLELPLVTLVDLPRENKTPADSNANSHKGTILIAEDHDDSRKTLAKVLRRMGYRVLEAEDGREVLRMVHEEQPAVVLMDVNMPGMDGVETTLVLRSDPRFKDILIFALTGDVTVVNQQRVGDAGVDGYLEKPVTWEKLEDALAKLRDRR